MKEETIESYTSTDPWARFLGISEAKVGKTCFLVASALGVLPWQKNGGIVDDPRNLHVLTFDSKAAGGLQRFLKETCKAPAEALNFKIYNMEQDLRATAKTDEYDRTFITTLMEVAERISNRCKGGSPLVLASSLTGMADGLLTSLRRQVGGEDKGTGMDMSKWGEFALQVSTMRAMFQAMSAHVIWEAHLLKMVRKGQSGEEQVTESVQIPGQSGVNFPYNVDQVMRLRRLFNQKWEGTNCDKSYADPRPEFEFIANGRNFNEALKGEPQYDLTMTFHKLGLKIGRWGHKSAVAKAPAKKS